MSNKVVGFVAKSDQRKMADRIGDADNFRTAKRITDNGVVTMRTQGRLRSRFDLEEDERKRVAVPVPTLTEIDLSGAKTQSDRLYYKTDEQDEMRIRSSDGLLSMKIEPLRRIIFKTSAIDPAKTISLWPMQEAEDGALTAPDVISDGNPAAVEIARTYHDEVYAYPRNDALVDYSTLLGLGFALTRIKTMNATLEGIQYSFEFSGFDQSGAAVVSAYVPSCPVAVEPVFSKRKYDTGGVKSISGKPYSIKIAQPGGVLPFAKHAALLQAKEHSGDAAIIRPIADLCRVTAFGQPWHGYLEYAQSGTSLWDSPAKQSVLLSNKVFGDSNLGVLLHQYVKLGIDQKALSGGASLAIDSCFQDGRYSPLDAFPVKLVCAGNEMTTLMHANEKTWIVSVSVDAYSISVSRGKRFDDFLGDAEPSLQIGQASKTYVGGMSYEIRLAENATSCVVLEYGGSGVVNRHWLITFDSETSASIVLNGVDCGKIGTGINDVVIQVIPFDIGDASQSTEVIVENHGNPDGSWTFVSELTSTSSYAGGNSGVEHSVIDNGSRVLLDISWNRDSGAWHPVIFESMIRTDSTVSYHLSGSSHWFRRIETPPGGGPGIQTIEDFSHSYLMRHESTTVRVGRCGISCKDGFIGFQSEEAIEYDMTEQGDALTVGPDETLPPGSQDVIPISPPNYTTSSNEIQVDMSPFIGKTPQKRLARQANSNSTPGRYAVVNNVKSNMVVLGCNAGPVPSPEYDFVFNPRTGTAHAVSAGNTGVFF